MYLNQIENLAEISQDYDAIICDIWGVLHNGIDIYKDAVAALREAKKAGKYILLLTNAPKCSDIIQSRFKLMGVDDNFWDATVTSGDIVQNHLLSFDTPPKVFHWGGKDDMGLYQNTQISLQKQPDQSDIIVCTGLLGNKNEVSSGELSLLSAAADKKIPFICANPDRSVKHGNDLHLCAGAVADIYIELGGGDVTFYGKPYEDVYQYCHGFIAQKFPEIGKNKILAIGDGLYTDIKGAQNWGIDCIFVKNGLHRALFSNIPSHEDFANLRTICEEHDVMPEYVVDFLT